MFVLRRCSRSSLTRLLFFFEQISSSSSTAAPVNTGVKIPTCKFSMREKFLTSPADLYRVFLNQEVSFTRLSAVSDVVQFNKCSLYSHRRYSWENRSTNTKVWLRLSDWSLSFVNLQMVQAFTHAPAMVEGERGGKFRLLEGNVFGEFTELVRLTFNL